eukprot:477028-Alexandrium_andersonii.AAC.1
MAPDGSPSPRKAHVVTGEGLAQAGRAAFLRCLRTSVARLRRIWMRFVQRRVAAVPSAILAIPPLAHRAFACKWHPARRRWRELRVRASAHRAWCHGRLAAGAVCAMWFS